MLRDQNLAAADLYLTLLYLVSLKNRNLEVTIRFLAKKIDQNAFKQFCFDIHLDGSEEDNLEEVKQVG